MGLKHSVASSAPGLIGATEWDADHVIDGQVDFPVVAAPTAAPANNVSIFGRRIANRLLPAFVGPSGLDSALQPLFARNRISMLLPATENTALTSFGIVLTGSGTATAAALARTNIHTSMRRLNYLVTTAATTAVAGWRVTTLQNYLGQATDKFGGFFAVWRFGRPTGAAANATLRAFVGFSSVTAAFTDANPSTTESNGIGVGCDAGDTNWQIIHRAGTGAATKIDTGFPKAVGDATEMYELALFSPPANATAVHYRFMRLSDETFVEGTISTNLPAATQGLAPKGYYTVGGTSSVIGFSLAGFYSESDF